MHPISQYSCPMAEPSGFAPYCGTRKESQLTALSISQRQNTDITIMTSEGDKVTLSADSQLESSAVTYAGLVRGGGSIAQVVAESYSMEISQGLSIAVEGDLSTEELMDIEAALKAIDKIMQGVLSGDMDGALSNALGIANLDTIAGLSAQMEIEQTVFSSQQSRMTVQAPGSPRMAEMSQMSQPVYPVPAGGIADRIMETVNQSRLPKETLAKPVDRYFSRVLESLSKTPEQRDMMSMARHIHSHVRNRMEDKIREGHVPETPNAEPMEPEIEPPVTEMKAVPV